MKSNKKLYLKKTKELGRILTEEEAFDFYTDNIMKNQPSCKFNPYRTAFFREKGIKKYVYEDYTMEELKIKAKQWHKLLLGSLVLGGFLEIKFKDSQLSGFVKFVK